TLYSFYDFERSTPLIVLVVLFVGAVIALGRWRGVGALAGLAVSLAIIVWFALPSLVDGNNAVSVALVTAGAVAIVALYLAHGVGPATDVALLSTFASLALTGALAWVFVEVGNFTGLTDDASFVLQSLETGIDPRGILLAGIVIGSLGVLDDVTVTQVSAVWELHRSRPEAGRRTLFTSALKIGRDHISSTVNTLFLAYAGAALPLLLLFTGVGESLTGVATREIVATEIVRALVGSIGLVASVPISTWLAAQVVTTRPPRDVVRPAQQRPERG
ncbi:MAG TPA: YibE/F family protein, partial [Ilumatobacter sp.]